jgi:hypothetical protein
MNPRRSHGRKRLILRKIREVIRSKNEAGLSPRAVASTCRISNSTAGGYLKRAEAAGLRWPFGAVSLLFKNLARFPRNGAFMGRRLADPTAAAVPFGKNQPIRQAGLSSLKLVHGILMAETFIIMNQKNSART